jgi:subtilisin family serine protease
MKSHAWLVASALSITACGPAVTVATPVTRPAPANAPARTTTPAGAPSTSAPNVPVTPLREAPRNWQLLDEQTDRIAGISVVRAERELLAGQQPKRTVIVAVIDGGVDTAHADLRANLWTNPKEIAGNGRDDDGNGYVDDVHGWNFIGGRGGKDVWHDTFEVTREYARCNGIPGGAKPTLSPAEQSRCATIASAFETKRTEITAQVDNYKQAQTAMRRAVPLLQKALGGDSLTPARVTALRPSSPDVAQARQIFLALAEDGVSPKQIDEAVTELQGQLEYGLNPSYNSRTIVGDDYSNVSEKYYGNADVMGPDAKHGTHVAGIIAAMRGNGVGIDGIAPMVQVMMIRAVPNGDERDKDIANAIRYAVDNGANIISMSFGKGYSPDKKAVDDAARYADAHNVLMVAAAGNDGQDLGKNETYPNPAYVAGGRAANWISVGASSWKGGDSLAAHFSNYGKNQVDVFAPGVDILSTIPGNDYERDSGTSMAAPVVSGLAALIMDYFPSLSAADVRRIILESATRHPTQMVSLPGSDRERVPFGSLSATGGIVNAYNAVKMAAEASRK